MVDANELINNNNNNNNDDEFEEFRSRAYSGGFQTMTRPIPKYRLFRESGVVLDDWSGDEHDQTNWSQRRMLSLDYCCLESEIWRQSEKGCSEAVSSSKVATTTKQFPEEPRRRAKSKEDSFWGFLEHEMRPRVNSAPSKQRSDRLSNHSLFPDSKTEVPCHERFQRSHQELHRKSYVQPIDDYPLQTQNHFVKKANKDEPHSSSACHWSSNLVHVPLIGLKSCDPRLDWFLKSCGGIVDRRRIALIGRKGVGKSAIGECFLEAKRIRKNLDIMNKTNQWEDQTSFDEDVSCCSLRHKVVPCPSSQRSKNILAAKFTSVSTEEVEFAERIPSADLYLVIFSVENRTSYETAVDRLFELRHRGQFVSPEKSLLSRRKAGSQVLSPVQSGKPVPSARPVILVANKVDLVRTRVVQEKEGRATAETYGVNQYLEISAAMGHEIDALIRATLKILESRFPLDSTPVTSCSLVSPNDFQTQKSAESAASATCDVTTSSSSSAAVDRRSNVLL